MILLCIVSVSAQIKKKRKKKRKNKKEENKKKSQREREMRKGENRTLSFVLFSHLDGVRVFVADVADCLSEPSESAVGPHSQRTAR
jgi:hypothetical protein